MLKLEIVPGKNGNETNPQTQSVNFGDNNSQYIISYDVSLHKLSAKGTASIWKASKLWQEKRFGEEPTAEEVCLPSKYPSYWLQSSHLSSSVDRHSDTCKA
mmetsp:Transcript_45888/g.33650  ORF Transcript_45888/g.33650 Transcript_45888/m.33650 type:complete len:101 (+) Transcript_45888:127-429(+)